MDGRKTPNQALHLTGGAEVVFQIRSSSRPVSPELGRVATDIDLLIERIIRIYSVEEANRWQMPTIHTT